MPIEFSVTPRSRKGATGGRIRTWRSKDGRYMVSEISVPGVKPWYRGIRVLVNAQVPVNPYRRNTKAEAIADCERHRSM